MPDFRLGCWILSGTSLVNLKPASSFRLSRSSACGKAVVRCARATGDGFSASATATSSKKKSSAVGFGAKLATKGQRPAADGTGRQEGSPPRVPPKKNPAEAKGKHAKPNSSLPKEAGQRKETRSVVAGGGPAGATGSKPASGAGAGGPRPGAAPRQPAKAGASSPAAVHDVARLAAIEKAIQELIAEAGALRGAATATGGGASSGGSSAGGGSSGSGHAGAASGAPLSEKGKEGMGNGARGGAEGSEGAVQGGGGGGRDPAGVHGGSTQRARVASVEPPRAGAKALKAKKGAEDAMDAAREAGELPRGARQEARGAAVPSGGGARDSNRVGAGSGLASGSRPGLKPVGASAGAASSGSSRGGERGSGGGGAGGSAPSPPKRGDAAAAAASAGGGAEASAVGAARSSGDKARDSAGGSKATTSGASSEAKGGAMARKARSSASPVKGGAAGSGASGPKSGNSGSSGSSSIFVSAAASRPPALVPPPRQASLPESLAELPPAELLAALQGDNAPPTPPSPRSPSPPPSPSPSPTAAAGAGTGTGASRASSPSPPRSVGAKALLEAVQIIAARKLYTGAGSVVSPQHYAPEQLVALVELLDARCRHLEGARQAGGKLAAFALALAASVGGTGTATAAAGGASSPGAGLAGGAGTGVGGGVGGGGGGGAGAASHPLMKYVPGAVRERAAAQLPPLLPRLLAAVARLGYAGEDVWAVAPRILHTALATYTGSQVAAVVRALVCALTEARAAEADADAAEAADAAASPTPTSTSSPTTASAPSASGTAQPGAAPGSGTSSSSSSGGGNAAAPAPGLAASLTAALKHPALLARLRALAADGGISGDDAAAVLLGLTLAGGGLDMDHFASLLRRALQQRDSLSPGGVVQLLRAVSAYCEQRSSRSVMGAVEVSSLLESFQEGLLAGLAAAAEAAAAGGAMRPHEFTDAVQSLAAMRHYSAAFMRELASSVQQSIASGDADKTRCVTTALYAAALFGHPAPGLFAAAASRLRPRLRSIGSVNLARIAWSYAVAGERGGDGFLEALVSELASRRRSLSFEARGLLLHALRIWAAHPARSALARPELLAAAGGGGGGGRGQKTSVSELQRDVFGRLKALGYSPQMEVQVGLWSVDMCVSLPGGSRVAVEVDGPSHFTANAPHRPLGTNAARDGALRSLGLALVAVDYRQYQALGDRERGRHLRRLVEAAASST